jgi:hypothetical protein
LITFYIAFDKVDIKNVKSNNSFDVGDITLDMLGYESG